MDPVTSVPFADWGYSRYGITYFTPTMETDSDFWDKRKEADKIYKEITGINYWANPDMNSQMRVLMDCLLNLCPDVETYSGSLQKHLIALWEKHDVISVLNRMLQMSDDPLLVNDDNRVEANIMMNQITHLIFDYLSFDNSFRRFNTKASVGSNVMQTHTPEFYISWVYSVDDPADLFTDYSDYTILYIDGDTTVSLYREGELLETMEFGTIDVEDYRYMSMRDKKLSVLVPGDREYEVAIRSNIDQKVEALDAIFQIGLHAPDETMKYSSEMKAGDVIHIGYNESGRSLIPDGDFVTSMELQTEKDITSIDLLLNAYSYPDNVSWRDLVLVILMAGILLITTIVFLLTILPMWIRHKYKRDHGYIPADSRFRPLPIICVFLIQQLFLTKEFITALYEPSHTVVNIFKVLIGFFALIIAFYGYRRIKNRFHKIIIFAVLLLTGADVMMTTSILAGAILYIAAYILLCYNYAKADRPGWFRTLVWILLSAAGILLMMRFKGDFGYMAYAAYAYVICGAALLVTSFTHSARISRGSFLLFVAGIMIIINTATGNNFLLHFVSAALHYIAVCILASTGSGFSLPTLVPEYASESETAAMPAAES